jgi:hypothetical protein
MKITTSKGKTFDINHIWEDARNDERLMIELEDDRPFSKIAEDFEGIEVFEKTDKKKPNSKEVFTGYTRLVNMSQENYEGVTRLILKKKKVMQHE